MHVSRLIRRSVDAMRATIEPRAAAALPVAVARIASGGVTREQRTPEEQERLNRRLSSCSTRSASRCPAFRSCSASCWPCPSSSASPRSTAFQRDVYFFTLVASALATALFIAPTAFHRMMFGEGDRPHIIKVGTRLLILGLIALALAMNGAILLICDVLFGPVTVVVTMVATTSVFAWLWFGMGLLRRRSEA